MQELSHVSLRVFYVLTSTSKSDQASIKGSFRYWTSVTSLWKKVNNLT